MKILADMNLPPKIADILTQKGIESKHWYIVGASNAKDTELLSYAYEHGYIILTYDMDFTALLASSHAKKPSVIQIRTQGFEAEELAQLIVAAVSKSKKELRQGAILTIDPKRARLRLLPL